MGHSQVRSNCRRESTSPSPSRMKTTMMSLLFVLLSMASLTSLALAASLEERELLGCSADQLLSCISEIEKAFEDCGHLNSTDEIMVCINDILAATNCQACLCDVLPFLC